MKVWRLKLRGSVSMVTIVEPNAFGTDWSGDSVVRTSIAHYDYIKKALQGYFKPETIGNLEATVYAHIA